MSVADQSLLCQNLRKSNSPKLYLIYGNCLAKETHQQLYTYRNFTYDSQQMCQ